MITKKHKGKQSLMNEFSNDINTYFLRSRGDSNQIIESEKLKNYIIDCGKWLQKSCETKLKRHIKETNSNRRRNNNNNMDPEELEFFETLKYSQNTIKYDREWEIFTFGSESWGTSTRDSDIDMAIFVNFSNNRPQKKYLLHSLAKIIGENDNDGVLMIKELLHAKYPIIRITQITYGIKIDVSIADRFCRRRVGWISEIIHKFEQPPFEISVKPLIVFIKHWSKQKSINNAYYCYLNSFGYTLLVIKFLQYYCYHTHHQSKAKLNVSNLSHLVYKFFEFYAKQWNPLKHAIRIRSRRNWYYGEDGNKVYFTDYSDDEEAVFDDKQWFKEINGYSQMEINDPINAENNVAIKVGPMQCQQIQREFQNAYYLIKQFRNGKIDQNQNLFQLLTKQSWQQPIYYQPPPTQLPSYQAMQQQQQQQQPQLLGQQQQVINNNDLYQQQMADMAQDQQFQDNLLLKYADGADIELKKEEKEKQEQEQKEGVKVGEEEEEEEEQEVKEGEADEIEEEVVIMTPEPPKQSDDDGTESCDIIADILSSGTNTDGVLTNNDGSPDEALISDIDKIELSNEEIQSIGTVTNDSIHSDMNINNEIHSTYDYHDVDDEHNNNNNNTNIKPNNYRHDNNKNIKHNNYNQNQRNNLYHHDDYYNPHYYHHHDRSYMKMDNIPYHKSPFKGGKDDNNNNNNLSNNHSIRKRRDRDSHHLTERNKFNNNGYNGYNNYNNYNSYNSHSRRRRSRV